MGVVERSLYIVGGLSLTFTGLGATLAFGVFAFIGIPLLCVGLGVLSAGVSD